MFTKNGKSAECNGMRGPRSRKSNKVQIKTYHEACSHPGECKCHCHRCGDGRLSIAKDYGDGRALFHLNCYDCLAQADYEGCRYLKFGAAQIRKDLGWDSIGTKWRCPDCLIELAKYMEPMLEL